MYMLGALEKPTEGRIVTDNTEISKLKGKEENLYRLEKVGFVFQNYFLIPTLTAIENVMLLMELAHKDNTMERARFLLEKVKITKENKIVFQQGSQEESNNVLL